MLSHTVIVTFENIGLAKSGVSRFERNDSIPFHLEPKSLYQKSNHAESYPEEATGTITILQKLKSSQAHSQRKDMTKFSYRQCLVYQYCNEQSVGASERNLADLFKVNALVLVLSDENNYNEQHVGQSDAERMTGWPVCYYES